VSLSNLKPMTSWSCWPFDKLRACPEFTEGANGHEF
jgi:hypothetical protein